MKKIRHEGWYPNKLGVSGIRHEKDSKEVIVYFDSHEAALSFGTVIFKNLIDNKIIK